MNEYARARGKESRLAKPSPVQEEAPRVLKPLSDIDQARVVRNRRLVLEHMPEFVPEIKAMAEAGLIDGWRSVKVQIFKKDTA